MRRHIPNALTSARLLLAFFFPLVEHAHRLTVVLVALATEYLDGALSRRWQAQSTLGRVLDPIADKVFFAAVGLTFVVESRLAPWELACLAIRDLCVALWSAKLIASRDWAGLEELEPHLAGKATTVLQYACLFDILLSGRLHAAALWPTTVCGAWAAAQYYRDVGAQD